MSQRYTHISTCCYFRSIMKNTKRKNSQQLKMTRSLRNHVTSFRVVREITQTELARAVGVSRQTISSIENELYMPSVYLALRLAQYFRTTIEKLFILVSEK